MFSAPDRCAASTTTVARASPAITRLRCRNRGRVGWLPAAAHSPGSRRSRRFGRAGWRCPWGSRTSTPQASTPTVLPPTTRAPRWAAASMPYAPPETTTPPRLATRSRSHWRRAARSAVAARAPTTATDRTAASRRSPPTTNSPTGGSIPSADSWVGHSSSAGMTKRPSTRSSDWRSSSMSCAQPNAPVVDLAQRPVAGPDAIASSSTAPCCARARARGASPGSASRASCSRADVRRSARSCRPWQPRPPQAQRTGDLATSGRSTAARSASVHATRSTRSTPRAESRPRPSLLGHQRHRRRATHGTRRATTGPGTSALARHGVPANRWADRVPGRR